MIDQEQIDNRFIDILESKINESELTHSKYNEVFGIESLMNMGICIDKLKPKSRYRKYKYQILEFVDALNNESNLEPREVVKLVDEYLNDIIIFLRRDHGFEVQNNWFYSGFINLFLDLILIVVGIAKYYYYIPLLTIISIVRNINKLNKAKKQGKYIDF
jgi:hypothetical protein